MSVFNTLYNSYRNFEPVNLYNWEIEFILDGDAYNVMNNSKYLTYFDDGKTKGVERKSYSWQDQSDILTFMCHKCNLPKKKINEVNTYCMGLKASFNAGINIDSSLSLSFDESSNRIVSKILTNLSNLYSSTYYIYSRINNLKAEESCVNNVTNEGVEPRYANINKVSLANSNGVMVGGSKSTNFNEYINYQKDGRFVYIGDINNRDLTIKVKLYRNKYGYYRPNEYFKDEKPLQEFVFYKCFINNLNYGDGYDYSSEENTTIECEIMYNWYTTSNVQMGGIGDLDILRLYKDSNKKEK